MSALPPPHPELGLVFVGCILYCGFGFVFSFLFASTSINAAVKLLCSMKVVIFFFGGGKGDGVWRFFLFGYALS